MQEHKSEVARLRQQIEDEHEAAQRGLSGIASGFARHDFITKRCENIARAHEQLITLVGPDTAIAIVAETMWTPEDQGKHA
jgi:hypothetical protein